MIRELVHNDHLPDYQLALEDEMVISTTASWQPPKAQVHYPVLDPEAHHDARLVAPNYDVYYLEQARLVGEERDAGAPRCRQGLRCVRKQRYQRRPNP